MYLDFVIDLYSDLNTVSGFLFVIQDAYTNAFMKAKSTKTEQSSPNSITITVPSPARSNRPFKSPKTSTMVA